MIKDYAKIDPDTNLVLNVIRVEGDDDLTIRIKLQNSTGWLKENWVSLPMDENANAEKRRGGIGFTYLPNIQKFRRPKPFPSWVLNSDQTDWDPPVANTDNLPEIHWDETNQQWLQDTADFPTT